MNNYTWIKDFWQSGIEERKGRRWEVAALIDGDFFIRDAAAYYFVRDKLRDRRDVEYKFFCAWDFHDDHEKVPPGTDLLFLGRLKPFLHSRFAPFTGVIEKNGVGKFVDPNNGQVGHMVRYGDHNFRSHEIEQTTAQYRRYDVDYGILIYRQAEIEGETRTCVAIAGLSALATLLLTAVLTNDHQRQLLSQEIGAVAPLLRKHTPKKHLEVVVRVQVKDSEALASILDSLNSKNEKFDFRVEAVAVGVEGEKPEVRFRRSTGVELAAQPSDSSLSGGRISRVGTNFFVDLPRMQFALLLKLAGQTNGVTVRELCRHLGKIPKEQPERNQTTYAQGALKRLVHQLNKNLTGSLFDGDKNIRIIHFRGSHENGHYLIGGARIIKS